MFMNEFFLKVMCFSYSFYLHNFLERNVYPKQARNHIWQLILICAMKMKNTEKSHKRFFFFFFLKVRYYAHTHSRRKFETKIFFTYASVLCLSL